MIGASRRANSGGHRHRHKRSRSEPTLPTPRIDRGTICISNASVSKGDLKWRRLLDLGVGNFFWKKTTQAVGARRPRDVTSGEGRVVEPAGCEEATRTTAVCMPVRPRFGTSAPRATQQATAVFAAWPYLLEYSSLFIPVIYNISSPSNNYSTSYYI